MHRVRYLVCMIIMMLPGVGEATLARPRASLLCPACGAMFGCQGLRGACALVFQSLVTEGLCISESPGYAVPGDLTNLRFQIWPLLCHLSRSGHTIPHPDCSRPNISGPQLFQIFLQNPRHHRQRNQPIKKGQKRHNRQHSRILHRSTHNP